MSEPHQEHPIVPLSAAKPEAPITAGLAVQWGGVAILIALALITFSAFLPALGNGFVRWDDDRNLLENPSYRGLRPTQLTWMFTTIHMGHYIPVTWMTLGLDFVVWGMNPVGYHLTSLLIHSASACVFYLVAVRLLRAASPTIEDGGVGLRLGAAFAALLFSVHPLRAESVAWVTERRDVLSGVFYLLTVLAYLRFAETHGRGRPGAWLWYLGSLGLGALALLSKSIAMSLPLILLLLDVYPLRRLRGGPVQWLSSPARNVLAEKIPFVVLSMAAGGIALFALTRNDLLTPANDLRWADRIAVSVYSLAFYVWKLLVPARLSPLYELPSTIDPLAWPFTLSGAFVCIVSITLIALWRRRPGILTVWIAYVVILLPVVGLVHAGPQLVADRYTYLASLGCSLLAGAGLWRCWRAWKIGTIGRAALGLSMALAICVVTALGVLTWQQTGIWRDSQTLWTHALVTSPSGIAHAKLGLLLIERGALPDATRHFREAVRFRPRDAEAHNNLGIALAQQGEWTEAIVQYGEALRLHPGLAKAHNNLGIALAQQGEWTEAVAHYLEALRIQPGNPNVHNNLALALLELGRPSDAVSHYREALRLRPDDADLHQSLGLALTRQGRLAEAIAEYRESLRLDPEQPDTQNNLGIALARDGRLNEALVHFREAVRMRSSHAEAHHNWGLVLARQGDLAEATRHLREAVRINPGYAEAHNNLGIALAMQGQLSEAADHFREAIRIRPGFEGARLNLDRVLGTSRQ